MPYRGLDIWGNEEYCIKHKIIFFHWDTLHLYAEKYVDALRHPLMLYHIIQLLLL